MNPESVLPVLLAQAYRLVDLRLVERGAGAESSEEEIARLVAGFPPGCDLVVAKDAARHAFAEAADELDALAFIEQRIMGLELGCPVVRDPVTGRAVLRIIDPDPLVAACLARSYPLEAARGAVEALLGWPPLLPGSRGEVDGVIAKPLADLHLHLGGALPPALEWIFVLVGLAEPPEDFLRDPWREAWGQARQALREVARACGHEGADLRGLLAGLTPVEPERADRHVRDWPLGFVPAVVGDERGLVLTALVGERQILVKALASAAGAPHPPWHGALVKYLKLKNAFHFYQTYRGGVRGLDRFRRVFSRRRLRGDPLIARVERWRMGCAVENLVRGIWPQVNRTGVATTPALDLELRVSMARGSDLVECLRGWLAGVRDVLDLWPGLPLRCGLVIHHNRTDQRQGPLRPLAEEMTEALVRLLGAHPPLRPFIVGLDVAGDELGAPPRTFAPAYHRARELLDVELPGRYPQGVPARLGFTHHAGEDFRDLLTGLRHVDEAAHVLGMRPRDRIGHGLALFISPAVFYIRRPRTYPTASDLALDLVWCWSVLRERPELAERARRALFDRLGFNKSAGDMDQLAAALDADGLQGQVLEEEELYERIRGGAELEAKQMVAVRADPSWIALVTAAQEVVVRRLLGRKIAIELNPTSNLIIGNFSGGGELPYLRALAEGTPAAELPLVVGTDDPGLFHSSLRGEYDVIAAGLAELGCSSERIRGHLERLRAASVEWSFIPPWTPRGPELRQLIERLIDPEPD